MCCDRFGANGAMYVAIPRNSRNCTASFGVCSWLEKWEDGIEIGGKFYNNLRYADDVWPSWQRQKAASGTSK